MWIPAFNKFHEAYHLLRFSNEKQILERAYSEYLDLKKANLWGIESTFREGCRTKQIDTVYCGSFFHIAV